MDRCRDGDLSGRDGGLSISQEDISTPRSMKLPETTREALASAALAVTDKGDYEALPEDITTLSHMGWQNGNLDLSAFLF